MKSLGSPETSRTLENWSHTEDEFITNHIGSLSTIRLRVSSGRKRRREVVGWYKRSSRKCVEGKHMRKVATIGRQDVKQGKSCVYQGQHALYHSRLVVVDV